jgi:hypothetical protein
MLLNDQEQQERLGAYTGCGSLDLKISPNLDLEHHLFVLTFDSLHIATLPSAVHNVLETETGTGLWAIEFGAGSFQYLRTISNGSSSAQKYPMAKIIGSDLSPMQQE